MPSSGVGTADLLVLPLSRSAPPPSSVSFYVANSRAVTRNLIHADGFNTLFASVQFPSGSLASLDGASLGPGDSVRVTLSADPGTYGLRLEPAGLRFAALGRPTVVFSYARYGDLGVARGSRYADAAAYAAALTIWRETAPDRWSDLGASGTPGSDLRVSLTQAGHYLAAALR